MKADVQYNDFVGTAAADISDALGFKYGDYLDSYGKYFNIDENRFKIVGISIYGTESFFVSFYCVDLNKSSDAKEHIVKMRMEIDDEKEILRILFKRLHIVLHSKFDRKYPDREYDEEIEYTDFHTKMNRQHDDEE